MSNAAGGLPALLVAIGLCRSVEGQDQVEQVTFEESRLQVDVVGEV